MKMKVTASILKSKKESNADLALSVSKVKTFDSCKAKYRYCYIEKLPRKEWHFHVFGKFLHQILEDFHNELMEDSNLDFEILMNKCFKESIKKYKSLTKSQIDDAFKIIQEYLSQLKVQKNEKSLPDILAIEKSFFIDLGGKVLLNGYIDRIQVDPDQVLHVADYKTTKDKKYLTDYFQLLTYAFALMLEDPELEKIRTSYVLLRHGFEYITKEYTRKEVMKVGDKFIKYAENIGTEKLWRPEPQFLCKYCDYLDVCNEGKRYLVKRGVLNEPGFGAISW